MLRLFFDVALLAQMGRGCAELFLAVAGEVRGRAETELPGYFPESDIRVTDFLVDKFGFPFLHPLIGALVEVMLELPVERAFRNTAQTGKLLHGLYLPVIVQDEVLELAPHSGSAGKKASQFVFGIKAAQYQNDFLLFKNMHVPAQQSRFQIEQNLPQGMKQRLTDGQGVVVGDNRFLMSFFSLFSLLLICSIPFRGVRIGQDTVRPSWAWYLCGHLLPEDKTSLSLHYLEKFI